MTHPIPDTGGGFQQQAEDPSSIAVDSLVLAVDEARAFNESVAQASTELRSLTLQYHLLIFGQ